MAATTSWQRALKAAQEPVTAALRELGFRKHGNHYNRSVDDDLVQVVSFQSGPAVSSLQGSFTVSLGVYVRLIAVLEGNDATARYVTDSHCEIRFRLSNITGFGADKWWPLNGTAPSTGVMIADALQRTGVPFLDRYASHSAIRRRFDEDGALPFHSSARSALLVAVICTASEAPGDARMYFDQARAAAGSHRGFLLHVDELQAKCGA